MSTEQSIVPASPDAVGEPAGSSAAGATRRSRSDSPWFWWVVGAALLLVSVGIWAAFTRQIGYFEFRPGSARPTAGLVRVGADVETFSPDSEISYTTISLRRSTVATYVWAWFDDDVEVVPAESVLGERTQAENRQFNLQLMDTSKQEAIRAALTTLGYDVPVEIEGVVIVQVEEGSAAAGVLTVGDTIVSIDGEDLGLDGDVTRLMEGKRPGDTVTLGVQPPDGTEIRTVDLVLGPGPDDDPDRGLIGVHLQPRLPEYQFPFEIDIESGDVGGPSAGLAFTLGIIDVLTPGELTGGLRVAVTGTIDAAGNVGPVGGVKQKTAVVVDSGYDVFLVPSLELDEARARAGDAVQVIAVDTLSEALDALASLGGSGLETAAGPG